MLSKARIAKLSDVPITTVKSYMEHYEEYFTPQTESGGKRIGYPAQSVEVVRRIRELSNQQLSRDEIRSALRQEFEAVWTLEQQPSAQYRPPVASESSDDNPFREIALSLNAAWEAVEAVNQMNDELGRTISKQKQRLVERGKAIRNLYDLYNRQTRIIAALEERLDSEAK